jgi:nucleotide-binding universal stress UspA family protein
VATDGSKTATMAVDEACKLARGSEARLRIVHVVDSPYTYADAWYPAGGVDPDAIDRSWRRAGQAIVDQAAAQARAAGAAVEPALLQRQGQRVSRAIVDEATRWGAGVPVLLVRAR